MLEARLPTPQDDKVAAPSSTSDVEVSIVSLIQTASSTAPTDSTPIEHGLELIETFFERIYPLPSYSFLHPHTTRERFIEGILEECLLLALCAITALHLEPSLPARDHSPSAQWADAAEQLIWHRLESPSIPRLQALLLCINYRMETKSFQRAFMLAGLAARAATAMRLNHERTDLDFVSAEVRRRIVWSLKVMDSYFSIGLPEFELCAWETIYLELPCREDEFNHPLQSPLDPRLSMPQICGEDRSFHFCIRLATIRRDVMKLTRSLALYDQPFPPLAKLMQSLDRELSHICGQMPGGADLSSLELSRLINTRWLPRHIMMHISWHQCWTDLHRLLLPQYPDAAPLVALQGLEPSYVSNAEHICLQHAIAIVQILSDLNQQCTFPHRLEFDSAICAYHATRLLLFISRCGATSARPSPEFAASRAELCLAAIKRFYRPSALVKPIVDDMERMIKTFSPHSDSPSDVPSPELETDRRDPALRLSGPARARQGLEIHSLLRRSGFFDDSYVEEATSPGSTDSASATRRHMIAQQISALSSRVLTNGQSRVPNPKLQEYTPASEFASTEHAQPAAREQLSQPAPTSAPSSTAKLQPALYPWVERQDWSFEATP